MNCPEHLLFNRFGVCVFLWYRDIPRERVPLRAWLNPFRYSVTVYANRWRRGFTINRYGGAWHRLTALRYRFSSKAGW